MKIVKISKILDFLAMLLLLVIVIYQIFFKFEKVEYLIFSFLAEAIVKMIAAIMKSNYYEKHYKQLEEDNEFLERRIKELTENNK